MTCAKGDKQKSEHGGECNATLDCHLIGEYNKSASGIKGHKRKQKCIGTAGP